MDPAQKIIEVSQKIGTVQEFCEFSEGIHKILGCHKDDCDMRCYLTSFKEIFFDPNKDYDHSINVFIGQLVKYPKVSDSVFKLKGQGEHGVKNLISTVKQISESMQKEEEDFSEYFV